MTVTGTVKPHLYQGRVSLSWGEGVVFTGLVHLFRESGNLLGDYLVGVLGAYSSFSRGQVVFLGGE